MNSEKANYIIVPTIIFYQRHFGRKVSNVVAGCVIHLKKHCQFLANSKCISKIYLVETYPGTQVLPDEQFQLLTIVSSNLLLLRGPE